MSPATPPPTSPPAKKPPGTLVTVWFGLIMLCLAGELLLGLIGLLVYRDTNSHTLSGNPWEASHFPWHVIWSMRLLSILAGLIVGPLALFIAALPFRLLLPRLLGPAAQKPGGQALAYVLGGLLLLLLVARVMGWWGLGAVPGR